MKRLVGLFCFIWLINACTPSSTTTAVAVAQIATATASLAPTATQTFLPSATLTASTTPLPTIPTFTPTFDVSTIVTVTPAPKAECPTIDPTVKAEVYLPEKLDYPTADITDGILEFLNSGGNGQSLVRRLDRIYTKVQYSGGYAFLDVTGDQSPDFLYVELSYTEKVHIFLCKYGQYAVNATLTPQNNYDFHELRVENLIPNGLPHILITGTGGVSFPISTVYLYQWNGRAFSLVGEADILALREIRREDVDGNGSQEIILTGDNPGCTSCSNFIPQRLKTITLGWNGNKFVEVSNEFTPPQYRFQAIQDADTQTLAGKYEAALHYYQEAIFNQDLEWWSSERLNYEQHIANPVYMFVETPSVVPTKDTTEYSRLAAYAYYRIMLLQLVQNQETDATTTYNILQQTFRTDPYARPYVEMATAFWDAYQSTHKMYDGCAVAIQYAAEHPEILIPLGSDYHGAQSHTYVPADVCPFR